MMQLFENKVVVIVGGTSGLGWSSAEAVRAAGARLVLVGRDDPYADEAEQAMGDAGLVLRGDAGSPEVADEAVRMAVETFGGLDALYHVAGGSGRQHGDGPIHTVTDEGIAFTLQLNLMSALYSNRAAIRYFVDAKRGGAVLNMASVLAFAPSAPFFTTHVYAAAKAGIIGLTRSLAACYAGRDIRVNAIAPGLTLTPMAERAANDPTVRAFVKRKQPLDGGRMGRPEDLDHAVVFLLSDEARFITGQVLAVDGGWSVSEGGKQD